jgi:hypothetical protein
VVHFFRIERIRFFQCRQGDADVASAIFLGTP